MEHARGQVAALLRCAPDEIVFTSGGTEANNHALQGVFIDHRPEKRYFLHVSGQGSVRRYCSE